MFKNSIFEYLLTIFLYKKNTNCYSLLYIPKYVLYCLTQNRVVCPNLGQPALTSSFTKYDFGR